MFRDYKAYADAIKSLWEGRAEVYALEGTLNEETGRTEQHEALIIENEPCRISHTKITSTDPESEAALVDQGVELIISKDLEIPPGSKIVVTQHDVTKAYEQSGKAAIFSVHQQIPLILFRGWA